MLIIFGDWDADGHEEVEHDVNESEGNDRRNHLWNKTSYVSLDISEIELFSIQYIRQHYRLIDWLFTVLRPSQEFFTYMETSPLPVKACKI